VQLRELVQPTPREAEIATQLSPAQIPNPQDHEQWNDCCFKSLCSEVIWHAQPQITETASEWSWGTRAEYKTKISPGC
jgi:hypothetical protein